MSDIKNLRVVDTVGSYDIGYYQCFNHYRNVVVIAGTTEWVSNADSQSHAVLIAKRLMSDSFDNGSQ